MPLIPSRQARPKRRTGWLVVVVLLGGAAFWLTRELRLPPPARIEVTSDRPAIAQNTQITVVVRQPALGLERAAVTADGAGFSKKLLGEVSPAASDGRDGIREDVVFRIRLGKQPTPEIKPGTVTLEITAQGRGTRLRKPAPVVERKSFEVRLEPPALAATSEFVHLGQGGAEAVVYDLRPARPGDKVRDGVQVGKWFFPGYPLPGATAPTQRFALFAAPYDLEVAEPEARAQVLLTAEDELGNRAETQFIHKYLRRPLRKDTIAMDDAFMKKVTDEIYARTPALSRRGDLLADYLQLNRDLRERNMVELRELAAKTEPRFLWSEPFLPMANAAVKGSFADRRTYLAGGKPVDTQDHLGLDLASSKQAPVQAANRGKVVLARYFGVFGNCVVIDHGYGLQSLYAHLSTTAVKEGAEVTRGQEIGRTGATGLAGGDHLHFTMVLHGLPITPIEWWDAHWLTDRLDRKLAAALPYKP